MTWVECTLGRTYLGQLGGYYSIFNSHFFQTFLHLTNVKLWTRVCGQWVKFTLRPAVIDISTDQPRLLRMSGK